MNEWLTKIAYILSAPLLIVSYMILSKLNSSIGFSSVKWVYFYPIVRIGMYIKLNTLSSSPL